MTADMATITSTSTYTAKADVSFKGYYLNADGDITSSTCQAALPTFIARGNVVDCCESAPGCVFPEPCTACAYPTACSDDNGEVYDFSVSGKAHTWPCQSLTCKTLMIYESYPHTTKGWSKSAHWCVGSSDPTVLYRNYESTVDMTITGITSKHTSSPTSVPASTTTSMPQNTSTSDSSNGGNSSNKAGPIAGGVVGGVAAVALVIGALFFIMKRQKKKNLELQAVNEIGTEYVAAPK